MPIKFAIIVAMAASAAFPQTKTTVHNDAAVVQEILKLEEAFTETSSKKDVKFFERNVADDFVWISRFGRLLN